MDRLYPLADWLYTLTDEASPINHYISLKKTHNFLNLSISPFIFMLKKKKNNTIIV